MKIYLLILSSICLAASFAGCEKSGNTNVELPDTTDTLVVELTPNEEMFTNPGMGWNLMYYTFDGVSCVPPNEKDDLLDWVPCDIISNRVSWASIEPVEGQYNWQLLDEVIDPWIAVGKRVAFKFYTNFLWDNSNRQATPLWVKEAGAQGQFIGDDDNPDNDAWVANYGDPILLQKLGNFYNAVASHYHDTPIEFIELGSIGRVGEGTSYQMGVVVPTDQESKIHIDLLRTAFPNTQLIINDDYGVYACTYAKTQGYGVDDHSIGVGATAGSPGRPYNQWIIGGPDAGVLFQDATAPIALENETWQQISDWYLTQMVGAKANYCRIHQNPSRLQADSVKNILKEMNLKMGYRIHFPAISFPEVVDKGTDFEIAYTIKNAAFGYLLKPYYPMFTIVDTNDQIVAKSIDLSFRGNDLKSAADNVLLSRSVSVTIPSSASGKEFSLYVSMADEGKNPILNLPYESIDNSKQYFVKKFYAE